MEATRRRSLMVRKFSIILALVAATLAFSARYAVPVLGASSEHVLITQKIDETQLVRLVGNTRPEAKLANDQGREPDGFAVDHMFLQLKRDPQAEKNFDQVFKSL